MTLSFIGLSRISSQVLVPNELTSIAIDRGVFEVATDDRCNRFILTPSHWPGVLSNNGFVRITMSYRWLPRKIP